MNDSDPEVTDSPTEVTNNPAAVRSHGNRAVLWAERRLVGYADSKAGSLALGYVRRYGESSRNSVSALVINAFMSVVPALLAVYAIAGLSIHSQNSLARHLIYDLHLRGPTAALVARAFGTVASNAAAATLFSVLMFAVFGLPVGKILQDFYARAWRVSVGSPTDQWRFAVWFVAVTIMMGLQLSEEALISATGVELFIPAWFVLFLLFAWWTPYFLLHGRIEPRRLFLGALTVAASSAVAVVLSQLLVGAWINDNGRWFGAFGVALALLMWGQVIGTIWLAGAVFGPVYYDWREGWRRTGTSPFKGSHSDDPAVAASGEQDARRPAPPTGTSGAVPSGETLRVPVSLGPAPASGHDT
jgi:hypothetical protein